VDCLRCQAVGQGERNCKESSQTAAVPSHPRNLPAITPLNLKEISGSFAGFVRVRFPTLTALFPKTRLKAGSLGFVFEPEFGCFYTPIHPRFCGLRVLGSFEKLP
jgi:hypothetical protein